MFLPMLSWCQRPHELYHVSVKNITFFFSHHDHHTMASRHVHTEGCIDTCIYVSADAIVITKTPWTLSFFPAKISPFLLSWWSPYHVCFETRAHRRVYRYLQLCFCWCYRDANHPMNFIMLLSKSSPFSPLMMITIPWLRDMCTPKGV